MDSKASTPNAKGFYIWFNKKEKKEYYATPMTLYKVKVNKSKNSKYSYITYSEGYLPKITPKIKNNNMNNISYNSIITVPQNISS